MSTDGFAHDRFLVEQLLRPMVNLYQVTPLAVGETPAGGPIAFVRQKRMAIARRVVDFVPYGEWVPIPYNFDLLMDGRVIGHMNRKFQLAIGLDTLQNR